MTDNTLAAAIRAAVETQGVSWSGRTRVGSPDWLADGLSGALVHADGMTSRECVAAIIGECAQETDWFCSLTEYGGPNARYAPYYGRGCIQCTWESNYRACGDWANSLGYSTSGADMAVNPGKMATMPYAWLSAIWYFAAHIPAHFWNERNWNAISGLINAGNAGYYVPAYALRAKSINAALAVLEQDSWAYTEGEDMPSAEEIANAILDAQIDYQGGIYPGAKTSLRNEVGWAAKNFDAIPGKVWAMNVTRNGLPEDDPRAGKEVSTGGVLSYMDAFVADIKKTVIKAASEVAGDEKTIKAVREAIDGFLRTKVEPGTTPATPLAPNIHIVAAGETLKGIAAQHGVDMNGIIKENPGIEPNGLISGQRIIIPAKEN